MFHDKLSTCSGGIVRIQGTPDELKGKSRAEVCAMALVDPEWWAYLTVLEAVASMLRRLHHWAETCPCHSELVLALYKLAHHNEMLGVEAYTTLLACSDPHPLVDVLKSEPLHSEGLLWLDGRSLGDEGLDNLTMFISKFRFAWTAERRSSY